MIVNWPLTANHQLGIALSPDSQTLTPGGDNCAVRFWRAVQEEEQ